MLSQIDFREVNHSFMDQFMLNFNILKNYNEASVVVALLISNNDDILESFLSVNRKRVLANILFGCISLRVESKCCQ